MTPDERRMIEDLFDRLSAQRPDAKDHQAQALIEDWVRNSPDAAYMLVQTVLVYEHQLQEAAQRIEELEAERTTRAPATASGGSFLSGRLGQGQTTRPVAARSSREYRGQASAPSVPQAGGSAAWGAAAGPKDSPSAPAARDAQPQRSSGGGFLRSAMSTATGVAGGILAVESLRSLFGGGSTAEAASAGAAQQTNADPATASQDASTQEDLSHDTASADDDFDQDQDWVGDDFDIFDI